ncbi:DUF2189 domain-containing protein [Actibacterium sp. XHP0104]|uniref:DUF2189 domain-containing protein n=1 Tax=Actibacterium sp. XHP0104 TaxID=2984335 RepID=UPI0021E7DE29|nr:DUF2189 domain-containing protein [Actibacterium sp. XHP0104]MCV2880816.1 DUF2189 domain-containing protein [Actibacterium sp. XHP0104]
MTDAPHPSAPPKIQVIEGKDLRKALAAGWRDFLAAPGYGVFFGGFYVICGMFLFWLTRATGQTYWLALAAFGFPLLGPFAAVGLYEVSHRLDIGQPLNWREILGVIWRQKDRQLPSISAIIILIFLFWTFIGHMIFALFLGLSTMTNISSSYEVFLTPNGMMMLAVGSVVGGIIAALLFAITVVGLPLLLDREIDFVTAMIVSYQACLRNMGVMAVWGVLVTVLLFIGMLPMFMGLLLVLPVLGHATWHLYRRTIR